MDEKGVAMGIMLKARVLVRKGARGFQTQGTQPLSLFITKSHTKSKPQDGNRENVTIIECVCANGSALLPLYLFKGQRLHETWVCDDPIKAYKAATPNGWTCNEIGVDWLRRVFHEQTKHHYPDRYRLLILDGHASHMSLDFVTFARDHKIVLLCFPAHATAILQPLDVGLFSPLSRHWTQVIEANLIGGLTMRKQDFCR